MRYGILVILVVYLPLCLSSVLQASIPPPLPLEDLVAQSERIVLVQALESECFLDIDGEVYTRMHLRLLWDLTQTAGKGPETTFEEGEISVVDLRGEISYVDSAGKAIDLTVDSAMQGVFPRGVIAVVCLRRMAEDSTRDAFNNLVGQWSILWGTQGEQSQIA